MLTPTGPTPLSAPGLSTPSILLSLVILVAIEYGWETYPSTSLSSLALVLGHLVLVWAVLVRLNWRDL